MNKLTATKIRYLKEPGSYGDGDGLTLILTGPMKELGNTLMDGEEILALVHSDLFN